MNERQRYVCAHALFDDGWPHEAIAAALGITRNQLSELFAYAKGDDGTLVWQRHPIKDREGRVIIRDQAGEIVERLIPS